MKLLYAPQSPCSRKARAAAIELGLHDQIDLVYVEVVPGRPNRDFGDNFNPLRKIPALVLDDGRVIYDSPLFANSSTCWRPAANHSAPR
jgi:glutathione S-transferase